MSALDTTKMVGVILALLFILPSLFFCSCKGAEHEPENSDVLLQPISAHIGERIVELSAQEETVARYTRLVVRTVTNRLAAWTRGATFKQDILVSVEIAEILPLANVEKLFGDSHTTIFCVINDQKKAICENQSGRPEPYSNPTTRSFERFIDGGRPCAYESTSNDVYCFKQSGAPDRSGNFEGPFPLMRGHTHYWGYPLSPETMTDASFTAIDRTGALTAQWALGCYPEPTEAVADSFPPPWTTEVPCTVPIRATYANPSCFVGADGLVYCYGDNSYGQLGTGDKTDSYFFPRPPSEAFRPALHITNAVKVVARGGRNCAIDSSRNLWCWGRNDYGQVGNGSRGHPRPNCQFLCSGVYAPVIVQHDVIDVALTSSIACALFTSGDVKCWGKKADMPPIETLPFEP